MLTGANKTVQSISRDDVSLTDREILIRYFGIEEALPVTIQSPLRDNDKRPSFSFQEWNSTVTWKDFGTGESGNIVSLMAKLWNVSYSEALLKMKLDTEYKIPRVSLIRRYKGKVHVTGNSTIKVRTRPWQDWDREFWRSFGIPEAFAIWCNVYPISHAFFTREKNGVKSTITVPMDKYAYAYFEWKDGKESIKLYQPYSQTMKWLSKHDASVWDLWKQAFLFAEKKSDDKVIITSSRKDAMCLWYNLKVPAMALQGEGYLPKPHVMKQVLERFKHVYLWYDNDFDHGGTNPGQENARKLIDLYPQLHNIYIPEQYHSKDPSDLVKNHGVKTLQALWKHENNTQQENHSL